MQYVICLESNGEILRTFSGPLEDAARQIGQGELLVVGLGSWLTHRVIDGQVVALPEPRVPPFEGAVWDAHQSGWIDPMICELLRPAAVMARRFTLRAKIGHLEARQARPLREIQVAQALRIPLPPQAVEALCDIEREIALTRNLLLAVY